VTSHLGAVRGERRVAAAAAGPLPGHAGRVLRTARAARPAARGALGAVGRLPARHPLRLRGARAGQRAPAHGAVRAHDQHVQREDLSLPLVLAGHRGAGDGRQRAPLGHRHVAGKMVLKRDGGFFSSGFD